MTAQELLKSAKPQEALDALQNDIKQQPDDAGLRLGLFQLLAVRGQWNRAILQVQTAVALDSRFAPLAVMLRNLVELEQVRAAVFSGQREPQVFGPTPPWLNRLLAKRCFASGGNSRADFVDVYSRAVKEAPARAGKIDGRPFEWLMDADARFGPSFELYLQGNYYWVPLEYVARIDFVPPGDLHDLLWLQARVTWVNGGTASGHVPVRYPGTEKAVDPNLQLACSVEWDELASGCLTGIGVRILSTDDGDFPLTKIRSIEFATKG